MCLCFRGQHFGYTYTTTPLKHANRVLGNYFMNSQYLLNCWLFRHGGNWHFHFCTRISEKYHNLYVWRFYYSWKILGVLWNKEFTVGIMQICKGNSFSIRLIIFKGNNLLKPLYFCMVPKLVELSFFISFLNTWLDSVWSLVVITELIIIH